MSFRLDKKAMVLVLEKVLGADEKPVKYYWKSYHKDHEYDELLPMHGKWSKDEIKIIEHAISWGYLTKSEEDDEHHVDDMPDGVSHYVSVSLSGFEFVAEKGKSWLQRVMQELLRNMATIVVSVLAAVIIAYALDKMNLK